MAQDLCYLCRAEARLSKGFDQGSRSLTTLVQCPRCGRYRVTPQAWTNHERACLAAYVQYEQKAGRRPPLIEAANWKTMARLGEALLHRSEQKGPETAPARG
jgi:hypothetical protein